MVWGLRRRWGGLPLWGRWVLAVYVGGFLEGFGAHVLDLSRDGIHAYAPFAWIPLQVFFVSLVVLDPLVVALVGCVRAAGVRWGAGVMLLDAGANWAGNARWLREDPVGLVRLDGLLGINLFAVFVLASAFPLHRAMSRVR